MSEQMQMPVGPLPFNFNNHYWRIGVDEVRVYSSARNIMVTLDDPAYVAWSAGMLVSPIGSEEELAMVLRQNAILPEWLLSARSFIQPSPDTYTAEQLLSYATVISGEKLSGTASHEARLRALELRAQGNAKPSDEIFAFIEHIYTTLADISAKIGSGRISRLDQVNAAFG